MEMIAMLNGLNGPYMESMSPAVRATGNAIRAARSLEELAVIDSALPGMAISNSERLFLKTMLDEKVRDLMTPFYYRPGYWLGVAVVAGVAWYHREKIKSWFK